VKICLTTPTFFSRTFKSALAFSACAPPERSTNKPGPSADEAATPTSVPSRYLVGTLTSGSSTKGSSRLSDRRHGRAPGTRRRGEVASGPSTRRTRREAAFELGEDFHDVHSGPPLDDCLHRAVISRPYHHACGDSLASCLRKASRRARVNGQRGEGTFPNKNQR